MRRRHKTKRRPHPRRRRSVSESGSEVDSRGSGLSVGGSESGTDYSDWDEDSPADRRKYKRRAGMLLPGHGGFLAIF